MEDKIYIQYFDPNILNVVNEKYSETKLAYLVSSDGIDQNLIFLTFIPEIYSPNYSFVKDEKFVDSIRSMKMELIPRTVNEKDAIQKMLDFKVEGMITDYPDRVIEMRKNAN